jgi:hypothetical protein
LQLYLWLAVPYCVAFCGLCLPPVLLNVTPVSDRLRSRTRQDNVQTLKPSRKSLCIYFIKLNTSTMADSDDGYRSRSQSRRRRRQNQRQRQATSKAGGGGANADSMTAVQEEEDLGTQPQLNNPATQDTTEMQPFEHIKPPSQSMDGPVTYARAQRGEIPMRGGGQPQNLPQQQGKGDSDILAQDGLKLRLELNLDIEVELKASIHGDLTLAVMS